MNSEMQQKLIRVLREELIPAEGCTEPIALAYCAAKAREALGAFPEKIVVSASGNIIKNVKSVIVPNTGGKKGIETAAAFGAAAGHPNRELEVLRDMKPDDIRKANELLARDGAVEVRHLKTPAKLHIVVELFAGVDSALAEIRDAHTHIIRVEKNGDVLYHAEEIPAEVEEESESSESRITLRDVLEFAEIVPLEQVSPVIERQIAYNTRIAEEGLSECYGANVGKTYLETYGDNIKNRCIAKAAAGSDARMNGAELPVVINSGSGNQGITVSLPVIEYATGIGASHEELIRALVVSNLTAIYQKQGIGRLSAYCGAVSAATASVIGIAWLDHASYEVMEDTIKNTLGDISGIVCDGAKASCAAKIATSLQAGLLCYEMAKRRRAFCAGDGLVKASADLTVEAIGQMASRGMVQTDEEILNIMVG